MSDALDVLEQVGKWKASGKGVAIATVITTWGSSPRPVGSHLAVEESGAMAGTVSGGCVHAAVVDEVFFPTYGPGATGVGWDLGLLGLALHLAGGEIESPSEFESSPEAREFSRRSAAAWGEAHLAAGGDPDQVAAAVEATTTFYVPDPA